MPQATAAKTKADILIESFRDGSSAASYHGNITLKRGLLSAVSPDGTQGLLRVDALVCPSGEACEALPMTTEVMRCISPMCGGSDVLLPTSAAFLVVDLEVWADGSETATVTDLITPFDTAFDKIEPKEID